MEGMNGLPPGFRFHPTDEELINDYLKKKVSVCSNPFVSIIAEIDLYKFNPWDLPGKANFGEKEWFFFSPREKKYPNGARPNRAAASGYWKATGTDKPILSRSSQCIGVKKALVFYVGRAPNGTKTDWMMHEYRLLDNNNLHPLMQRASMRLDDWVLCRIRQKTGPPEPKQEQFVKKKEKRAHDDAFDEFMEDEYAENISFLQQNPGHQQHYHHQPRDHQTLILDFQEGTSSSRSISYDSYDPQSNLNGSATDPLEAIDIALLDEFAPNPQSKRFCSINSSTFLNNNSCMFQHENLVHGCSYFPGIAFSP